MSDQQTEAKKHLYQLAIDIVAPWALYVVARLGVADRLAEGPKTADALASELGADAGALHRVLRLVASRGIFTEDSQGRFGLTPASEPLRREVPGSMLDGVLTLDRVHGWFSAEDLLYTVKTGATAFERRHGMHFYEYFQKHPEGGFHRGMASVSTMEDGPVAESYDFSPFRRVVDVGGGSGGLLAEILKRHGALGGVLLDRPHVLPEARALSVAGVADRCELVAGDFFESVPPADVYILKRILHNWSDAQCVKLLGNCRESMTAGGRVLVVEGVVAAPGEPDFFKLFDVHMMLLLASKERTEGEFRALFEAAGLRLTRVIRTPAFVSIIEGERA